jgi:hypothetical protein
MTIYECGKSVAERFYNTGFKYKTYVCVIESAQDLSLNNAFNLMVSELQKSGIIIKSIEMPIAYCSIGNTYTLAHEIVKSKNNTLDLKPSNIIRHIMSTTFTMDSLYIDIENNEVIDITHEGIHDIKNNVLSTVKDFEFYASTYEYFINECLHEVICSRKELGKKLDNAFCNTSADTLKVFKIPCENFKAMVTMNKLKLFLSYLDSYQMLKEYYNNYCGLSISFNFNPPERTILKQPKSPHNEKKFIKKTNNIKFNDWRHSEPLGDTIELVDYIGKDIPNNKLKDMRIFI